jgi:hypothetical protein
LYSDIDAFPAAGKLAAIASALTPVEGDATMQRLS